MIEDEDGNEPARGLCNYATPTSRGEAPRNGEARRDGEEAWRTTWTGRWSSCTQQHLRHERGDAEAVVHVHGYLPGV